MKCHFSSRALLLASLAVATCVSLIATDAGASAPLAGSQAPGYYRVMVGDIEVTALSDGTIDFPMDTLLVGESPTRIRNAYKEAFQKLPAESSMNQFLVNTGTKLVLVDAGSGIYLGPTLGNTVANLRAAGYTPDQVDEVVITHMHADHIGGLVHDGKRAFPNAVLRIAKADLAYWMKPANESNAPEGVRPSFAVAQKAIRPYIEAGKLQPFEGRTDIVPGVTALPAPGHTAGHTYYDIESRGERLLVLGDAVHSAAVQFRDPSVRIAWDSDDHAAENARQKIFAEAASEGYLVAGAHIPFPGIGHVTNTGETGEYAFVPLMYSVNRRPKALVSPAGVK